jgi:hypothetical protein
MSQMLIFIIPNFTALSDAASGGSHARHFRANVYRQICSMGNNFYVKELKYYAFKLHRELSPFAA